MTARRPGPARGSRRRHGARRAAGWTATAAIPGSPAPMRISTTRSCGSAGNEVKCVRADRSAHPPAHLRLMFHSRVHAGTLEDTRPAVRLPAGNQHAAHAAMAAHIERSSRPALARLRLTLPFAAPAAPNPACPGDAAADARKAYGRSRCCRNVTLRVRAQVSRDHRRERAASRLDELLSATSNRPRGTFAMEGHRVDFADCRRGGSGGRVLVHQESCSPPT